MITEADTLSKPPKTLTTMRRGWIPYETHDYGTTIENERVKEHLPLVASVVGRIAINLPPHIHREDLYSPGLIGLLKAMRNYDPENAASFASYARHRIRGAVLDELRKLDWVPRSVHEKARRVENTINKLQQRLGRTPKESEIAEALDITEAEYQSLSEEIRPAAFISINMETENQSGDGEFEPVTLADESVEGPDAVASKHELSGHIKEAITKLPSKMQKVLAFYYFEHMRLREIAEILGVTESRVSQIHTQAILTIRSSLSHL